MFLILRNMRIRVRYNRDRLKKGAQGLVVNRVVESRNVHMIPTLACSDI